MTLATSPQVLQNSPGTNQLQLTVIRWRLLLQHRSSYCTEGQIPGGWKRRHQSTLSFAKSHVQSADGHVVTDSVDVRATTILNSYGIQATCSLSTRWRPLGTCLHSSECRSLSIAFMAQDIRNNCGARGHSATRDGWLSISHPILVRFTSNCTANDECMSSDILMLSRLVYSGMIINFHLSFILGIPQSGTRYFHRPRVALPPRAP